MTIIRNNGASIRLPFVTFARGDKLVDPGAWALAKKNASIRAHLSSGRLEIRKEVMAEPMEMPPEEDWNPFADPAAEGPGEPTLPLPVDADGDGKVDLSALKVEEAVAMVAEMDADTVMLELDRETRKTVLKALEARLEALTE